MTVSTHKTTAKGSGGIDDGKNSGTVAAGGTLADSIFQAKNLVDINVGADVSGSKISLSTGTAHVPGIQRAFTTGGTLAYNPNGRTHTRSSTDTGFLIRSGSPTLLGSKAATGHFLSIPGSDNTSRRGGNIHPREDHKQAGTWATSIFDLFSGALLQSDGTAKEGITSRGSDSNFIDPLTAGGATQSVDSAANPTRAIPGEFVMLSNFANFPTNLLNYSAVTG